MYFTAAFFMNSGGFVTELLYQFEYFTAVFALIFVEGHSRELILRILFFGDGRSLPDDRRGRGFVAGRLERVIAG